MPLFDLFVTEIDECLSLPCQNNGSCSDNINGYICSCVNGFSGDNCEIGKCVSSTLFTYTLKCSIRSVWMVHFSVVLICIDIGFGVC